MTEANQTNEQLEQLTHDLTGLLDAGQVTHGMARAIRLLQGETAISAANTEGRTALETNPPQLQAGLHIGCGKNIIPGYTNLDIFPNKGVDVVCDAREGLPFADNQFERVFSEHMLEHVDYPRSVKSVLGEMVRVTKPGGNVIVGVPDSEPAVRAYASGDTAFFDTLREKWYGRRNNLSDFDQPIDMVSLVLHDQADDPNYAPHFWGYDNAKLTALLQEAGLQDVAPWQFDPAIALPKREWNSVYLQGTKPDNPEEV